MCHGLSNTLDESYALPAKVNVRNNKEIVWGWRATCCLLATRFKGELRIKWQHLEGTEVFLSPSH